MDRLETPQRSKLNYFNWLRSLTGVKNNEYIRLFRVLDSIPYRWFIPNDGNRGDDGLVLRENYDSYYGIVQVQTHSKPCSFLEFLIALADRCSIMMKNNRTKTDLKPWFWMLLENSGLIRYTDDRISTYEVNNIVNDILDRHYGSDGYGGLFPIKNVTEDQRKIEIWYQMCQYLLENFFK